MKKIKKFVKIIFLIILIFLIVFLSKVQKNKSFDDILFLKLFYQEIFNQRNERIVQNNEYKFDITYGKTKLVTGNLQNTIDKKTLINEKIAPGTKGKFDIILNSNKKSRYIVKFISENEKPKYLRFKAFLNNCIIGESDSLEKLSESLTGTIEKYESKRIIIEWYWKFDNMEDYQDTQDSKKIKIYKFDIYVQGEKV